LRVVLVLIAIVVLLDFLHDLKELLEHARLDLRRPSFVLLFSF
jgi:hypothetical protein